MTICFIVFPFFCFGKRKAPEAGFGFRDDQYNRGTTLIPVERRALVGYFHILCLGNGASRNRLPLPARRFCSGVRVPSPAPPACTNRRFSVRAFLDGTVPSSHLCKDYSTRPPLCQRVIENILSSAKTREKTPVYQGDKQAFSVLSDLRRIRQSQSTGIVQPKGSSILPHWIPVRVS